MGRPRILKKKDRYPFSDKNCSGGLASKGLRRQIKDGELTTMSAEVIVWGKWQQHERKNNFARWLRRRKKRLKK